MVDNHSITTTYQPSRRSQFRHELRIPLTGIMGMVHFLQQTPLTPQQKSYVEIIQTSANRLLILENMVCSTTK